MLAAFRADATPTDDADLTRIRRKNHVNTLWRSPFVERLLDGSANDLGGLRSRRGELLSEDEERNALNALRGH